VKNAVHANFRAVYVVGMTWRANLLEKGNFGERVALGSRGAGWELQYQQFNCSIVFEF
jgi:hypothetical protein